MRKSLIQNAFISLFTIGLTSVASAQQPYVYGPVELIGKQGGGLTVLGQQLSTGTCASLVVNGRKVAASTAAAMLRAGNLVYVEFKTSQGASIATAIAIAPERYVAGSSMVQTGGFISRIDARNGTIDLGKLRIDVTSFSPEAAASLSVGAYVEVSGIQPISSGTLVSAKLIGVGGSGIANRNSNSAASTDACAAGAEGSLAKGVGGSGVVGVGGSGASGVGGSGVLSVSGSATPGVGGSGVLSVVGSAALGVGGSGALSTADLGVGGSGALGNAEFQALGVGGSGKQ